jgi:hypothetical protein
MLFQKLLGAPNNAGVINKTLRDFDGAEIGAPLMAVAKISLQRD